MIDHVTLTVSNLERSKKFYFKALEPLGYEILMEFGKEVTGEASYVGMGVAGKPDFWLKEGSPNRPSNHVAFRAKNRPMVDAFYKAGLANGGRDNGAPGVRTDYHPGYYAAFLHDPDGHNIEAVCHEALPGT